MVAMKWVLPETSPLFVASARMLPAGIALIAFAALTGRPQPRGAAAWGAVALFALVDGTLFQLCLAEGLTDTPAGMGSVLIDSQPLTVVAVSSALGREPVSRIALVGLLLGLLGLVVLEAPPDLLASITGAAGSEPITAWGSRGELLLLCSAQCGAAGALMVRWLVEDCELDPVMATGWHLLLGGLPLLALSLLGEPQLYAQLSLQGLGLPELGALAYASLGGGAIAYGLFFAAAARGGLVRLSALTLLTPGKATIDSSELPPVASLYSSRPDSAPASQCLPQSSRLVSSTRSSNRSSLEEVPSRWLASNWSRQRKER